MNSCIIPVKAELASQVQPAGLFVVGQLVG